jgi:hypothetical protein
MKKFRTLKERYKNKKNKLVVENDGQESSRSDRFLEAIENLLGRNAIYEKMSELTINSVNFENDNSKKTKIIKAIENAPITPGEKGSKQSKVFKAILVGSLTTFLTAYLAGDANLSEIADIKNELARDMLDQMVNEHGETFFAGKSKEEIIQIAKSAAENSPEYKGELEDRSQMSASEAFFLGVIPYATVFGFKILNFFIKSPLEKSKNFEANVYSSIRIAFTILNTAGKDFYTENADITVLEFVDKYYQIQMNQASGGKKIKNPLDREKIEKSMKKATGFSFFADVTDILVEEFLQNATYRKLVKFLKTVSKDKELLESISQCEENIKIYEEEKKLVLERQSNSKKESNLQKIANNRDFYNFLAKKNNINTEKEKIDDWFQQISGIDYKKFNPFLKFLIDNGYIKVPEQSKEGSGKQNESKDPKRAIRKKSS